MPKGELQDRLNRLMDRKGHPLRLPSGTIYAKVLLLPRKFAEAAPASWDDWGWHKNVQRIEMLRWEPPFHVVRHAQG